MKLLAVLCALALVPAANYTVDPSALFVTSRADAPELAAAALMLEGHNVTGLAPNYNERLLRREYIMGMDRPARVIVAGSSRGEFITGEMLGLKEGEMFNVSVAGAELEDMMSFIGLLLMRDLAPETVVLSLDPWMISDAYDEGRYRRSISDGLYYLLDELGNPKHYDAYSLESLYDPEAPQGGFASLPKETRGELFSISYFQSSLRYLFSDEYALYKEVRATGASEGKAGIVRADGSYCYSLDYRDADAEISTERARASLPNVIGYEDYDAAEYHKDALLRKLIEYLIERGIEVKLVLQPVGNTIYDFMAESGKDGTYAEFFTCEELFRSMAAETGADIAGSFDPYSLGYDMGDFYDGYHLKETRVAEIVASPELLPYVD